MYPQFRRQHPAKSNRVKERTRAYDLRFWEPGEVLSEGCKHINGIRHEKEDDVGAEWPHSVDYLAECCSVSLK